MTRVGFIGLGNMGAPIARRLAQAGMDPLVFDQSESALQKLAEEGVRTATSCAGVAAEADLVGVCVRDDADVEEAVLGTDCSTKKRGCIRTRRWWARDCTSAVKTV